LDWRNDGSRSTTRKENCKNLKKKKSNPEGGGETPEKIWGHRDTSPRGSKDDKGITRKKRTEAKERDHNNKKKRRTT